MLSIRVTNLIFYSYRLNIMLKMIFINVLNNIFIKYILNMTNYNQNNIIKK